ncbi:MAG TPA: tetratricopeptide repeat protein [Candidatus Binataceae bacterium]|nr:tetratricopeptide repeat protein [Candidatus Binataceae bacterium]
MDILKFLIQFGGLFFEYPRRIAIAVVALTAIFAYFRYWYLRDYRGEQRFALWRSVIVFSLGVAIVSSIIGWLTYRYWGLPCSFTDGQIGILIAEVPGDQNREQQSAYQNSIFLQFQSSEQLRGIAHVKQIERPLPPDADDQQAEALKIGRWLRAALVLRPFVVEGTQEPWLTVVNPQRIFQPQSNLEEFPSSQLATLDKLPLPQEIAQIAKTVLALALGARGSYKEAAQILSDVLKSGRLPEATASREALDHLRGNYLLLSGNTIEAIAEYKEALRLNPNDAEVDNDLALALNTNGQHDEAITQLKEALRLEPGLAAAHNNLGAAFDVEGRHDAAIPEYREALRLNPDLATAHNNLGIALNSEGQHDAAIAEYKQALRLNPGYAAAHDNLGAALDHEGQHAAAIAEYRKALRLDPDFALAHYNLGAALYFEGQPDAAVAEFEKAIRVNPNYAEAHNALGGALEAEGQHDAAIAEFKEAIHLDPGDARPHYNLGYMFYGEGLPDAAIAELKNAIRLNPDYAKAHYALGIALNAEGQHDAAVAELKEAFRLNPDLFEAGKAH